MSIGVVFQPSFPPERLRSAVEAAESSGVDEVWLWEDCFRESGLATATAALAWSSRIRLGIGVLPMPFRNVALAAMEIATIERLFPGPSGARRRPRRPALDGAGRRQGRVAAHSHARVRADPPATARGRGGNHRRTLRAPRRGAPRLAAAAAVPGLGRRRGPEDASSHRRTRRRHRSHERHRARRGACRGRPDRRGPSGRREDRRASRSPSC